MSDGRGERAWVAAAVDAGVLPAGAAAAGEATRPWPVVLLTGLGAWLAAIPMMLVIGSLFGLFGGREIGGYVVGVLALGGAVVVLRSRGVPLFVEQLAVPALAVGLGAIAMGLLRDAGTTAGAVLTGALALGVAALLRASWLRVLLGAAALVLFTIAFADVKGRGDSSLSTWRALHLLLMPWVAVHAMQQRHAWRGGTAAAVEATGAGWALALLAVLSWWAGMTFLVGGTVGGLGGEIGRELSTRASGSAVWTWMRVASAALALAGVVVAASRWHGLRHPAFVAAGLVLVVLAAFMPSLGAVVMMLALLATSGRPLLAAAAGVAAAWVVGAFYYQLAWPLAQKAVVMAGAGAALGALAWWAGARRTSAARTATLGAETKPDERANAASSRGGMAAIGLLTSVVAILAIANVGIAQKERLIRDGRPVFVELAPVDPRSLVQGDFMRLNFAISGGVDERRAGLLRAQRPRVIAKVDARGVARLERMAPREAVLGPDELAVELTPKGGRWTLVTDAWFFAEGEGARWAKARYGEFRVDGAGRALLVGLRGANLEPL